MEAYIVKQTHEWSDKRAKAVASPPPAANSPRIVWADQIRKSTPQVQPLAYTKARDRVASPPPQGPHRLTRAACCASFLRRLSQHARRRPHHAFAALVHQAEHLVAHHPQVHSHHGASSRSRLTGLALRLCIPGYLDAVAADPSGVPHNVESHASSIRSLSPLPLSLPTDDFSASLLIGLDKRASTASTSSGRAPDRRTSSLHLCPPSTAQT